MESINSWQRFSDNLFWERKYGFAIDISRMSFGDDFFAREEGAVQRALSAMEELEAGAIANPDENRMVGHYWLRTPELAPQSELQEEIVSTLREIKEFAAKVHSGQIATLEGNKFEHVLVVGIGGSALGPQLMNHALASSNSPLSAYFCDNTDPDGLARTLDSIPDLARTLCIVISKSGGTKETANACLIAQQAWRSLNLDYPGNFVAVTQQGSRLSCLAQKESWLAEFPMWDWVGGRTSLWSAVGLLPAALLGFDVDQLLAGAAAMDQLNRCREVRLNPAALLALMWLFAGKGVGQKAMVVMPYKDRLELFSKYLQQLVMESLGKGQDLNGKTVNQGLTVFGNKGSTDQHAYVQQLREGLNNFFVVFIEVLEDITPFRGRRGFETPAAEFEVEPGITTGDYLSGFHQGTRLALSENGRDSITITVEKLSEFSLGMLIALFERAVGIYASLININAYHQPGVEAGKKAAGEVLVLQQRILAALKSSSQPLSAAAAAQAAGAAGSEETVFKILRHLAANGRVRLIEGASVIEDCFCV